MDHLLISLFRPSRNSNPIQRVAEKRFLSPPNQRPRKRASSIRRPQNPAQRPKVSDAESLVPTAVEYQTLAPKLIRPTVDPPTRFIACSKTKLDFSHRSDAVSNSTPLIFPNDPDNKQIVSIAALLSDVAIFSMASRLPGVSLWHPSLTAIFG